MEWESWFQNVAGHAVKSAVDAKYTQPYELKRLQLQALGEAGYYAEGTPGVGAAPRVGYPSSVAGIPTGWLLIGGVAVLAIVLAKS